MNILCFQTLKLRDSGASESLVSLGHLANGLPFPLLDIVRYYVLEVALKNIYFYSDRLSLQRMPPKHKDGLRGPKARDSGSKHSPARDFGVMRGGHVSNELKDPPMTNTLLPLTADP